MSNPDLIFLHAPSVYDFRRESILYGPVSDLVPSTPVFEMYPIGFTTMAEYLERNGYTARIVNLAVRMLENNHFDVEGCLKRLDAALFGIDLHWLPHAHGSIEVARVVKRLHPDRPVVFGGFSSSYYYAELIRYPAVDFVMRGDSTEEPMLALVKYICSGGKSHPSPGSPDAQILNTIPNLVWKDENFDSHVNPLLNSPENLDSLLLDYSRVMRAVVRFRDLASVKPFSNWMNYPITAAPTVRGCSYNCITCGGSSQAYRSLYGRTRPAFRRPETLAQDIRRIGQYSHGPVFILGDIRQGGQEYVDRFLAAIAGYKKPIMIELFDAASKTFLEKVAHALPNWTLEISMESHDEGIRRAFGRPYSNRAIERTIDDALEAGCQRLDLFFMVGLKGQTYPSVIDTAAYCRSMVERYGRQNETRVIPFISPLAPFLDPGSQVFEHPEAHGYHLFAHTLEEHRQLLLGPSWKYVLNYETQWMNRNEIVSATYESGRQLNLLKGEFGLIPTAVAQKTDTRITHAMALIGEIDQIMARTSGIDQKNALHELKQRVDSSNLSTVCDKRELEIPLHGVRIDFFKAAQMVIEDWWKDQVINSGRF